MIKYIVILFFFFTLVSCIENRDDNVVADSQECLVRKLSDSSGWVKIHVAEELITLGYRKGITEEFLAELERFERLPKYRIGIWRVLAKVALKEEDQNHWVDKIIQVYKDTSQTDRIHAAESLAKLNINLEKVAPGRAFADLTGSDTLLQAYVSWGVSVSAYPDSVRYQKLMGMLNSHKNIFRKVGAYALGFCSELPTEEQIVLAKTALNELDVSDAKVSLLKAAICLVRDKNVNDKYLSELKKQLFQNYSTHGKNGYYETIMALADAGSIEDITFLEKIFYDLSAEKQLNTFSFSKEDLVDIKAACAFAVLRITQCNEKKMAFPDWMVILFYAMLMLGVGFFYSKRNKSIDDYHLGGRSMNPILVGLSLFATLLSTLSYLSYPGEMIKYGPVLFASLAVFPLIYYIVGWFIIPRFMTMNVTSAYEILEIKIGSGVRVMATFFFLSLRLLWMATIIYATVNTAIISIFGIEKSFIPLICLIMAAITVVYTSMGGLKAVVITDSLQTIILILGAILTVVIIGIQLGTFDFVSSVEFSVSWEKITWGLDAGKRMTVGNAILMVFVWYICTAGSDQMAIQRYLATKDIRSARKSFKISLVTNFMVQLILVLVGLALLAYFTKRPYELPAGETISNYADSLFPRFIRIGLPVGITGLVTAGLISAAMSSLSSGLNSSSSVISEDIIKRFFPSKQTTNYLKQARIISIVIGVVVTLLCFIVGYVQGNLLEVVIKVVNLFVAPLFVLFFMALFVPFATSKATMAGGIISVIVAVAIAFFEIFGFKVLWIMPLSLLSGVAAGCLLSFFEKYIMENKYEKN